jgi:hypothetical protein
LDGMGQVLEPQLGIYAALLQPSLSIPPFQGPEWINSHQCTSWPFCPLDGLRFFIRHRMGLIIVDFFLLLTTVLFFFCFFCFWSFFLDLTSHIATLLTFLPS